MPGALPCPAPQFIERLQLFHTVALQGSCAPVLCFCCTFMELWLGDNLTVTQDFHSLIMSQQALSLSMPH